jgi:hypothetical protein
MWSLSERAVVPGQLRRWSREAGSDCGKLFLVIHIPRPELGDVRWDILQDGEIRNWSTSTIHGWSEVVDG